jgi:hypothetical protein
MQNDLLINQALSLGFLPLPGHCFIRLDPQPTHSGSIIIPDSARNGKPTDVLWTGTVLAMTPRHIEHAGSSRLVHNTYTEDFCAGDRIILALLMSDLDRDVILTDNTRIYAVIDGQNSAAVKKAKKSSVKA